MQVSPNKPSSSRQQSDETQGKFKLNQPMSELTPTHTYDFADLQPTSRGDRRRPNDLDILKKYREMAGNKRPSPYSLLTHHPVQNTFKAPPQSKNETDVLDRVTKLKEAVSSPGRRQKSNPNQGTSHTDNFRASKIRLIAEVEHESLKQDRRNERLRAFEVASTSLALYLKSSAAVPQRPSQPLAIKRERSLTVNPYAQGSFPTRSNSYQKHFELDEVKSSLSNLRQKISSLNKHPSQSFLRTQAHEDPHRQASAGFKRSSSSSVSLHNSPHKTMKQYSPLVTRSKLASKQQSKQLTEGVVENVGLERNELKEQERPQVKGNGKLEANQGGKLQANQAGKLEANQAGKVEVNRGSKAKGDWGGGQLEVQSRVEKHVARRKQLESIVEDIENENQGRQQEIKNRKMQNKSIEISVLEKRHRIQQLEQEVEDFKADASELSEEEEMLRLKKQKQLREERFQQEREKVLHEIKGMEASMKQQELRFFQLKEQELKEEFEKRNEETAKNSQAMVQDLEEKARELEELIRWGQARAKQKQEELDHQKRVNQEMTAELQRQNEMQAQLLIQIKKTVEERKQRKQNQKLKNIHRLKEEIQALEEDHQRALLDYQRETQTMASMFQAMRIKNLELENKLKDKALELEPPVEPPVEP